MGSVKDSERIVYTTGLGAICTGCRRPVAQCVCRSAQGQPERSGHKIVRVGRETQGRGGKGVTVITGLLLPGAELEQLTKALKQRCGAGGRLREDGVIELQGEQRDTVVAELARRGITAKRAGG
ncbi:MAG TPA: stress response translation initiation inhibitor YciH [Steroidobacteraceae bacterium]|nr:stress response translation initiation inhibitor YciH [Steroidobacteraceae bacterium]